MLVDKPNTRVAIQPSRVRAIDVLQVWAILSPNIVASARFCGGEVSALVPMVDVMTSTKEGKCTVKSSAAWRIRLVEEAEMPLKQACGSTYVGMAGKPRYLPSVVASVVGLCQHRWQQFISELRCMVALWQSRRNVEWVASGQQRCPRWRTYLHVRLMMNRKQREQTKGAPDKHRNGRA